MKRIFFILPALCLTVLLACDSDRRAPQSEGYQEQGLPEQEYELGEEGDFDEPERERAADAALGEEARQFAMEAAAGSVMEVELGQLALKKAQLQEVKEFAQMMVEDHRQLNQRLEDILQGSLVDMPEHLKAKQQEKLQELQNLSGMEFDKEYMEIMVEAHKESIENFESAREEVQDAELQAWIDKGLSVLRQHHEQAKQLKDQLENQQ